MKYHGTTKECEPVRITNKVSRVSAFLIHQEKRNHSAERFLCRFINLVVITELHFLNLIFQTNQYTREFLRIFCSLFILSVITVFLYEGFANRFFFCSASFEMFFEKSFFFNRINKNRNCTATVGSSNIC